MSTIVIFVVIVLATFAFLVFPLNNDDENNWDS
jgi:hypothetical protein